MKSIRIVDRSLAAASGWSGGFPEVRYQKPSVEDKRAYYWSGAGWDSALKEARALIASGQTVKAAAAHVGWTEKTLREALAGSGQPPIELEKPIVRRPRVKRTLKQRVKGLGPVNKKEMARAKRLYTVEYMTVREVAVAMRWPYERTYLVLQRAGTKFRRPGRRGSPDSN